MPGQRLARVNELLKREIAQTLFRVVPEEADVGRVTITQVQTSPNLRKARVFVSVRGNQNDQDDWIRILRRHRKEIQAVIGRNVVLKYNPQLMFILDHSVEEGTSKEYMSRTVVSWDGLVAVRTALYVRP